MTSLDDSGACITVATPNGEARVNVMTGEFEINRGSMVFKEYTVVSWREQFEKKRQAIHDMAEDGDGFTREEVHDLVLTANRAYAHG